MSFEPDASQLRVLDASPSSRRVVVAGPGAGKTATSVLLIESIAQSAEIDPEEASIVYVSFSRAAVHAALGAFGERVGDLAITVSAMTLDSLAWQLDDSSMSGRSDVVDFDEVVRRAARRLMSDYQGDFDSVVHLIVDEGQDFSRPRRELLAAVIDRLPSDAGFTVFGDPLQSIYDFFDDETEESEPAWDQVVAIAERARDRGAHGTLVAAVRLLVRALRDDASAPAIDSHLDEVSNIVDKLVERAGRIASEDEANAFRDQLNGLVENWTDAATHDDITEYGRLKHPGSRRTAAGSPLMRSASEGPANPSGYPVGNPAWPTLTSMRDVDAETRLVERYLAREAQSHGVDEIAQG